ncbi:hypothetical protein AVEN_242234-1 [Araneus ventricosus]|uniref:Uncharacterized protein n=1 Tax=Araneus ventricosus TaxID=182803 RepID=A0A4Y2VUC8_ARAVE|nr:hypothetical protein AVEN_178110-1 [Araneus ventricosus]GBO28314.1 hypothetical protein AVEN_242234-1 [Araneus ventricosus]
MAVNNSHVKGGGSSQTASIHLSAAQRFAKQRRDLSEFHRPQSTSTNLERLEVLPSHTPWEQGFMFIAGLIDQLTVFRLSNNRVTCSRPVIHRVRLSSASSSQVVSR